jgi:hypothetical protein
MNRKVSYTLSKIRKMRERFTGTNMEEKINELADEYEKMVLSPNGVRSEILHLINSNISSLGI